MSFQRFDYDVIANWIEPGEGACSTSAAATAACCATSATCARCAATASRTTRAPARLHQNGVNVIQIDMEQGLAGFDDGFFDHVIMSPRCRPCATPGHPREMLRVGREAVVSFPNFAYWRHPPSILNGRMPVSKNLPYQWYDTPNVRFFTIADFNALRPRRAS